jgi:hypothetical protein
MRTNVARLGLVALSVGLIDCGGGGDDTVKTVPANAQGAANVLAMTVDLTASLQGNDGATVALQLVGLAMTGPQQIAMMPSGQAAVIRSAESVPGPDGGSVNCTTTGCVYDEYASSAGAAFVLDGSVLLSTAGEVATVTIDVDITTALGGVEQVWTLAGALDVSPTLIDGTLINTGTGQGHEELTYHAVTLSDGQPTGGTLFARWSTLVQGKTYGAQATMAF